MSAATRFNVMSSPILAPGVCAICNGHIGPVIDTGLRNNWSGATYVCVKCVTDMYNQFPHDPPPVDPTIEESNELARVTGFLQGVKEVKDKLDGFTSEYFSSLGAVIPNVDFSRYTTGSRIEDVPADPKGEAGSGTSPSPVIKQNVRLVKQQGRDDVSGDSGDGLPEF